MVIISKNHQTSDRDSSQQVIDRLTHVFVRDIRVFILSVLHKVRKHGLCSKQPIGAIQSSDMRNQTHDTLHQLATHHSIFLIIFALGSMNNQTHFSS